MGQTERRFLLDVLDPQPELFPTAERLHDLVGGISDDDTDIFDPGVLHRLQPIEKNRLICDGDQLFCAGIRNRTKSRPLTTAKNQRLDGNILLSRTSRPSSCS